MPVATQTKQKRLEELIGKLKTEEGRRGVIFEAVRKGITDKPEYIEVAIQIYENQDSIFSDRKIVELLKKINHKKAIGYLIDSGKFNSAADLAEEFGEEGIQLLEEKNQLDLAYDLAIKTGNKAKSDKLYERLVQLYEEEGRLLAAAKLCSDRRDYERAISFYERENSHFCGAQLAEKKLGDKRKAFEILERGGKDLIHLIRLAEELGEEEKLKEFRKKRLNRLEKSCCYADAGDLARVLGNEEEALKLYEKALKMHVKKKEFSLAGDLAREKLGDSERARGFYKESLPKQECVTLGAEYIVRGINCNGLLIENSKRAGEPEMAEVYAELFELLKE